jgi:hypothetical protein
MRPIHLFLAALALGCASCGNNKLCPVSGKVLVDGAPAAGATVFFYRQDRHPVNDHLVMGIVQDDGSFELVCGPLGKGAPPGEYDVLIEWKQSNDQGKGHPPKGNDKLKGIYAEPKQPRLHATVRAGVNKLDPFELTDPVVATKTVDRDGRRNSK